MTTLSWGNGTLPDQPLADQLPPLVPDQVWVAAVVKVMPELPPASPELPVMAERFQLPAPAPVMSRKSALVTDTVAAVRVLGVPSVSDVTNTRLMAVLPLIVSVLVMVWLALSWRASVLTAVPVRVRLAKVLAPEITLFPEPVNETVPP